MRALTLRRRSTACCERRCDDLGSKRRSRFRDGEGLGFGAVRKLRDIVPEMIVADREVGDFVLAGSNQWVSPQTEKEALEFRILMAELDHRNYSPAVDPATGKQSFAFAYPSEVAAGIAAFRRDK